MTDSHWEIPPLDGAADISRRPGPGSTLADTRYWAGFGLLGIGGFAAVLAAVISLTGWSESALFLVGVAVVSVLTGAALVFEQRRRRQQRERSRDSSDQQWRRTVRPRV
ncbi:hypothetical protein [Nocardia harenae]|uniref:hypothetical protein n=1 Tax=Nocardia harenae TaxID=358707 RepID=UPI00083011BB|nr:hypothetical protein [Nocardia harenae]